MSSKLPTTPSRLIRLGLQNLQKAEESDQFEVDMDEWLVARDTKHGVKCKGSFAGATMVHSLGASIDETKVPSHFSKVGERKPNDSDCLRAMELLAEGEVLRGFWDLAMTEETHPHLFKPGGGVIDELDIRPTWYEVQPDLFKYELRKLAKALEKHGA